MKEAVWYPVTRVYDIDKKAIAQIEVPDYITGKDTKDLALSCLNGNTTACLLINAALLNIMDPEDQENREIVESGQAEGGVIAKANVDGISLVWCRLLPGSRNWACSAESVSKDNPLYGDIAGEKPDLFYDRETGKIVKGEEINWEDPLSHIRYIYAESDERIKKYSDIMDTLVNRLKLFDSMLSHAENELKNNPQMAEKVYEEIKEKRDVYAIMSALSDLLGVHNPEYTRKGLYKMFGELGFV